MKENLKKSMIMIHKWNNLFMDCNDDCYGIVYFHQIVMDVNVNVLNNKMYNLDSFFIVRCGIASRMNGYQTKLKKYYSSYK